MPVLALQQQSDWENNVYVLTTTRILVIVGVAYLFRSLYQWARPLMERLPIANVVPWVAGNTSSSYLPPTPYLLLIHTSSPPPLLFSSWYPPPPPLLLSSSSSPPPLILLSSSSSPSPPSLTSHSHFCMKLVCSLLTLLLIVL